MPRSKKTELRFPIKLTQAQRKLVDEFQNHLNCSDPKYLSESASHLGCNLSNRLRRALASF